MPELEKTVFYKRHVGFTSSPPNGFLSVPHQQQQLQTPNLTSMPANTVFTVNNNPHHLSDSDSDSDSDSGDDDDDGSEIEADDDHYPYRRHQPPAPPPPTPRANSNLLLSSGNSERPGPGTAVVNRGRGVSYSQSQNSRSSGEVATIAWMIILGDGMHNFINGVTIGAAFTQSIMEGISISVAVVCEEFPHELGDFSLLISSGMSMRKALGYNFISACTCYLGMIVGILIGDFSDATPYVFALAGGMFLYISLVDMMGELSTNLEAANRKRGLRFTAQMLILQNLGILIGVSIMFSLAKYSDKINFEGLVPPKNSDMPFTES
ncbi:PREDICTED: zinc transporter ZIP14-like [Rhagoletis zephyria]|uniref:zinc transporter ZIP14-like n=1 Tax=Rhagoletis zephyria TaxID=28612 RepID=UPI000811A3B5|nr:PREDICTED: zinc transporter ZIP14-like [Rhagoletis zephyria]